jgi:ABC-type transport system involved in cytochrome c biogenesis permease subunit
MDVVVQFNSVVLDEIAAVGTALSKVVVADVVAVHPLLPVTVTVNVPAVVAEMAAVVAPVLHK